MAILSKGTELSIDGVKVNNLKSTGELSEATEKLDVTTLDDSAFIYMDGLKNYGDSISFTCFYEKDEFVEVRANQDGTPKSIVITYPDTLEVTFQAYVSVVLSGSEVNAALEYTINLTPTTEIVFA